MGWNGVGWNGGVIIVKVGGGDGLWLEDGRRNAHGLDRGENDENIYIYIVSPVLRNAFSFIPAFYKNPEVEHSSPSRHSSDGSSGCNVVQ
jgi:hypothetical protein